MKVYELDDQEFKDMLIWLVYNGDANRRFEMHYTDTVYSMINTFKSKLLPTTIEEIMMDRETHYKNVLRWMFGRGVDIGVTSIMQPTVGSWSQKNEVTFGGGMGHIDLMFNKMAYELKTSRFPYKKDLPWSHAIKQLSYYMAGKELSDGRITIFDMIPLDMRTWALELTKKNIKDKRSILKRKLGLLRTALMTGDWTILPETKLSFITAQELDTLEFLEENRTLIRKASERWRKQLAVRQIMARRERVRKLGEREK